VRLADANSFVARCLCDPPYLARLLQTEAGNSLDVNDRSAILHRLHQLAGFIAKVQNHDIIALIPQTSALLRRSGHELQAFTAYSPIHQKLRAVKKLPKSKKAVIFLSFLAKYIRGLPHETCVGLGDVLTHERLLWHVGMRAAAFAEGREFPASNLGDQQTPRIVGFVKVGSYTYNPIEVCEMLAADRPGEWRILPAPCSIAYWADPTTQSVRLFRIGRTAAEILNAIDGRRGVAEVLTMAVRRGGHDYEDDEAGEFFQFAHQTALVTGLPGY